MLGCVDQKKEMTEEDYEKYMKDVCARWESTVETLFQSKGMQISYSYEMVKKEYDYANEMRPPSKYENCHQNLIRFFDIMIKIKESPPQDPSTALYVSGNAAVLFNNYCQTCYSLYQKIC
jgi:hypothetical protein